MRPYMPMMVLDGAGERLLDVEKRYTPKKTREDTVIASRKSVRERLEQLDDETVWGHWVNIVVDTSIRVHPTRAKELLANNGFVIPPDCAREPDLREPRNVKRRKKKRRHGSPVDDPDEEHEEASNTCLVEVDTVDEDRLTDTIHAFGAQVLRHREWQHTEVSKIKCTCKEGKPPEVIPMSAKGKFFRDYIVNIRDVRGGGCKYCHNIKCQHSSNRVYFEIGRQGRAISIRQRCYKKEPNRDHSISGENCSEYASRGMPLTDPELLQQLYPFSSVDKRDGVIRRGLGYFDTDDKGVRRFVGAATSFQEARKRQKSMETIEDMLGRLHRSLGFDDFSRARAVGSRATAEPTGLGAKARLVAEKELGAEAAESLIRDKCDKEFRRSLEGRLVVAEELSKERDLKGEVQLAADILQDIVNQMSKSIGRQTIRQHLEGIPETGPWIKRLAFNLRP